MKNIFLNIKLYVAVAVLLWCTNANAQDFIFSQFYEKPILRNPALAGIFNGDLRINAVYRNQWQSITVPYQTSAASVEAKFPIGNADDYLTVGAQFTNDVAGDVKLKRTQILPVINFHKSLNADYDSYLSAAFMAGVVTSQFDITKLTLDDQFTGTGFDPFNPTQQTFSTTSKSYMDMGVGLAYSMTVNESTQFYAGAGLYHFNKPKVAFYANNNEATTLDNRISLNAGLTTETGDLNRLVFFADYYNQGKNNQFIGGALYGIDISENLYSEDENKFTLYLGGFYRLKDAFIPIAKLDIYKLSIGMSYDVNTSRLTKASQARGGFEFSLGFRTRLNVRAAGLDKVRCVDFKM